MTRRIFAAFSRTLRAERACSEQVHFHQGPQGQAAVCYDAGCERPHLDVR
jgi:hypothetical protein